MVKAGELVAGDVIEVLGERLMVTGPARVERSTAVVDAASATEHVTLYLRASAGVARVRPGPTRRPASFPAAPAVGATAPQRVTVGRRVLIE